MSELDFTNDLKGRVASEVYDGRDGDFYEECYAAAGNIIEMVRADERKRIREALLCDESMVVLVGAAALAPPLEHVNRFNFEKFVGSPADWGRETMGMVAEIIGLGAVTTEESEK